MSDTTFVNGTTLSDGAGWAQDVNDYIYRSAPKWCGTAGGTANALTITTVSTNLATSAYLAGQRFEFKSSASANTAATTVAVDGLATKAIQNKGAALVGGEIEASKWYRIVYDGAAFQLESIAPFQLFSQITNSLSGDVSLSNTATYFDGPSVAQGTVGTWFASGTVTLLSGAASNAFSVKLWDGTTVIASGETQGFAGGSRITMSLSGYLSSPAGNIRISVKDTTATDGTIKFNSSGNSKDSTVSAVRIG